MLKERKRPCLSLCATPGLVREPILRRKEITEHLLLKKYTDHLTISALSVARNGAHQWSVTDDQMVPSQQIAGTELGDPVIPLPHSPVHKEPLGSENPLQLPSQHHSSSVTPG